VRGCGCGDGGGDGCSPRVMPLSIP
jgi:hypothetical protein